MTFTAIAIVSEIVNADENSSNGDFLRMLTCQKLTTNFARLQ